MEKVLIAGISGGQGRLVAHRLLDEYVLCGVDRHAWEGRPQGIALHRVDLLKRQFEDVLRTEKPKAVVHLGFVRHFRGVEAERHETNVRGTQLLLEHCVKYGVEQLVVVSSGYVYGAFAENPFYIHEDHPLSGSRSYPEIRDLVEVDTLASSFIWKEPGVRTAVLRPVSVLGTQVHSLSREILSQRRVPVVMGFDPMMQFIHEQDVAEAVALALDRGLQGAFNVTGPGAVPISVAIRECGSTPVPIPELLMRPLFNRLFRAGLIPWPAGVLDFMKYPVTLDGSRFEEESGFRPLFSLGEIFAAMREGKDP